MRQPSYFSGFDPLPCDIQMQLMSDAKPQYFKAEPNVDTVVICMHGFTGNPG